MSEATAMEAASAKPAHRTYVQKRWFTLIGLIPLGFYVVNHLLDVASSWSGPEAFDAWVASNHTSWTSWLWTGLLLFFFGFHALIGLKLMLKSAPLSPKPTRLLHIQYILQRVSALGVLAFVPAHVVKAKLLPTLSGTPENFAGMHHAFAVDGMRFLTVPVYLLGTLGVTYHLANGIWTACVTLGITQGAAAQNRLRTASILLFVFMLALAYGTIIRLMMG